MSKLRYLFVAVCTVCLFVSCSNTNEDNRYIEVPMKDVKRAVLVEEFTGQNCSNCPMAHQELKKIQQQYGEQNVIPVCIYATLLARYPLRTKQGDAYFNYWKGSGLPAAKINRITPLLPYTAWQTAINRLLQTPSKAVIDVSCVPSLQQQQIDIRVSCTANDNYQGKLQLYITEDSVVDKQKFPNDEEKKEYRHQHVLRTAVNGLWGKDITLQKLKTQNFSHRVDVKKGWNINNLSVVAFIYNDKGVEQVVKQSVKTTKHIKKQTNKKQ